MTGGTGRLARNWAVAVGAEHAVTLASRTRTETLLEADHAFVSLDDKRSLTRQLLDLQPDVVVHAAGMTDVDLCEADPASAHAANVVAAVNLAEVCAFLDVAMVQISTDHLFDGVGPTFDEATTPRPVNAYGRTKAAAESAVLERHPSALVVRTNFFGLDAPGRFTLSGWILESLRSGRAVHLFDDVHFSPVLATNLARDVHELIEAGATGVVNLPAADRVSKFTFGTLLAETFGYDPSLVLRSSIADRSDLVARPREMSLSSGLRDSLLGHEALTVAQHVEQLKTLLDEGFGEVAARNRTPYGRHRLEEEDIVSVSRVLRGGALTQGPKVDQFEREIAAHVGAEYAVAVSSGTAGLHIAALAADLGPGQSLVTSPITFVATANAARYTGADVAFVDVDPTTANLSPEHLAAHIASVGRSVGAVTAVHLAGLSADMSSIRRAASSVGAAVIEDAAHALGGIDAEGHAVGSCRHSDMTVFSLHPVKSIAAGEGGVVTTNDPDLYRRLLRLRSHGINKADDGLLDTADPVTHDAATPWRYEMQELGYNLRFTDIQSSLALSQLRRLDSFIDRRRELAVRYDAMFEGHDVLVPLHQAWRSQSAHHIYVLDVDFSQLTIGRGELMELLRREGFVTQVHYVPVPAHPYYRDLGHNLEGIPNALNYYRGALSIPLYVDLSDMEAERFSRDLQRIVETARSGSHAIGEDLFGVDSKLQ